MRADRRQIEASSWPGLGAFTSTPLPAAARTRPFARISATRASIWSVPSAASTASTCLPATTTAWPDIERAGGAQIVEPERDIGAVALGRLHAAERAFRHQDFRRDLMRAAQGETLRSSSLAMLDNR